MSSTSEATSSLQEVTYSRGSSVSSGLREEYEDLLRYAVVTPKFDGKVGGASHVDDFTRTTLPVPMQPLTSDQQTTRDPVPLSDEDTISSDTVELLTDQQGSPGSHGDEETERLARQLDQCCNNLKRNVLAEFGLSRAHLETEYDKKLQEETARYQLRLRQLEEENVHTRELLVTFEQSVARKDHVIGNLTRALQGQKGKCQLQQSFALWRLRMCDEKRQVFTSQLARRLHHRQMLRRSWAAWRSVIENNWKERAERACQTKAQEVCVQLTNNYEQQLEAVQHMLDQSQHRVGQLQTERISFEEAMKKAFMRGVCALNMEAMTMFHPSENGSQDHEETKPPDNNHPISSQTPAIMTTYNTATTTTGNQATSRRTNRPVVTVERHTTSD